MQLKFLGDAFDHWKGSVLSRLVSARMLHGLMVVPMITDVEMWTQDDLTTYANLLYVNIKDVLNPEGLLNKGRDKYFGFVPNDADIFLDPDTGISTSKVTPKHVAPKELADLITVNQARVLVIYQHSARGSFHKRLEEIIRHLQQKLPQTNACVYQCGWVAMIFLSANQHRIFSIQKYLKNLLRGKANERVWAYLSQN